LDANAKSPGLAGLTIPPLVLIRGVDGGDGQGTPQSPVRGDLAVPASTEFKLGDGQYSRRSEEDAAVLVLPHQISLVRMAWEYGAPSTVGLDECGLRHLSNISDLGIIRH
jgi:hypothetical protein